MKAVHRIEYGAVMAARGAVRPLPMAAVLACGTALGRAFHALDRTHRRLALRNLEAAFPSRSPQERAAIAREMFDHFGRLLTVLLKFSTMTPSAMLARVEFEGEERVRAAHALGRGVLLFTGHFGYWEINALVHALVLNPMSVLARPLDNPLLHDLLERVRGRTGNAVIYRRGAVRRVLRALAANQAVAVLIDQHIQVFALPLPGGRFRMVYEHAVDPPNASDPGALREFTQRCTDVLEMYVRRYPGLWLWMHRRWRDEEQPEGSARGMFPSATTEEDV